MVAAAVLVLALALASGATALTNGTAITESAAISAQPASAFVYNPIAAGNLVVSCRLRFLHLLSREGTPVPQG